MDDPQVLLQRTAELAAGFLRTLDDRPVFPAASPDRLRELLGGPLPDGPSDPVDVVERLAAAAGEGVVAIPSGRYFGFVIGGSVPAALAADWLTSAWDQNAGLYVGGPSASVVEEVAGGWLKQLLKIPAHASYGLVTGAQMAHVTALAAARFEVLRRAGWDVNADGLAGSPPIRVLAGAKRHATIDRALRLLGIGADALVPLDADGQGRLRIEALREALAADPDAPTIVCAQAGEVNTGAFDPLAEIADAVAGTDAWVHLDGAFGLWAAASPDLEHLVEGSERLDSWTVDAHKWLNVPYDSGIAFCAHPDAHRAAMSVHAEYLVQAEGDVVRDQMDWNPEFSRRARGFPIYAALRSLGRSGVVQMIERACAAARRFATGLEDVRGAEVVNEVVLNQVLFRFETDSETDAVLHRVQQDGRIWLSGTMWDGRNAIRLSVSNWQTGEAEIDLALEAFVAAAQAAPVQAPAR